MQRFYCFSQRIQLFLCLLMLSDTGSGMCEHQCRKPETCWAHKKRCVGFSVLNPSGVPYRWGCVHSYRQCVLCASVSVCSSHYINDSETTWSLYQLSTATFSCQQVDSHSYMWVSWVWHHFPMDKHTLSHTELHIYTRNGLRSHTPHPTPLGRWTKWTLV